MICFPLDNTDYDATGLGAFLCTRTRGVFSADDHFATTPAGGMSVRVSAGLGWLKASEFWGVAVLQDIPLTLSIDPADNAMNRVDAVCVRLDKSGNLAKIVIKKGTLAATPSIPAVAQNDAMFDEIYVATISIPAKTTEIGWFYLTEQPLAAQPRTAQGKVAHSA